MTEETSKWFNGLTWRLESIERDLDRLDRDIQRLNLLSDH